MVNHMSQDLWHKQMHWAYIVSEQHRLENIEFYYEALEVARSIMRQARTNVEMIVQRLHARGYVFADPQRIHLPPPPDIADWPAYFTEKGINIPVALIAWLYEVGTVDLRGTAPEWDFVGYHGLAEGETLYTDPLVVDLSREYIESEFEAWEYDRVESGADKDGPFQLAFAPDNIHKANISGGVPYSIGTMLPAADSLILNERHGFGFIAYIRHAFEWGAFPGFELMDNPPTDFITDMRRALEAILYYLGKTAPGPDMRHVNRSSLINSRVAFGTYRHFELAPGN